MKIIFLDIDGVMTRPATTQKNPPASIKDFKLPYTWDPECCSLLSNILEQENAEVVLSSDWRLHYSLEQMRDIFYHHEIDGRRLIGFTGKDMHYDPKNWELSRSMEIQEWVNRHGLKKWVAVDDRNLVALPKSRFVHASNPAMGFSDDRVLRELIYILHQ